MSSSSGLEVRLVVPTGAPDGTPTPAVSSPSPAPGPLAVPTGRLPFTGAELLLLVLLAAVLLAAGAALVRLARPGTPIRPARPTSQGGTS